MEYNSNSRQPVYLYSSAEAKRRGEYDWWLESLQANIACKEAIEESVKVGSDAKSVIEKFGYKRVGWVLSNTVRELGPDGFSRENRDWSKRTYIPPDKTYNPKFAVSGLLAELDGFVSLYREAYSELDMFGPEHCESKDGLDLTGRVLVIAPDVLKEDYWSPRYQLYYAHGGFGCRPNAIGRAVLCTCLEDGEIERFTRPDFIGPIKDEFLPDWAKEQLERLRESQEQEIDPGTMSMGQM